MGTEFISGGLYDQGGGIPSRNLVDSKMKHVLNLSVTLVAKNILDPFPDTAWEECLVPPAGTQHEDPHGNSQALTILEGNKSIYREAGRLRL